MDYWDRSRLVSLQVPDDTRNAANRTAMLECVLIEAQRHRHITLELRLGEESVARMRRTNRLGWASDILNIRRRGA
jgi:hypothetical protein